MYVKDKNASIALSLLGCFFLVDTEKGLTFCLLMVSLRSKDKVKTNELI